ncbi:hypothetical protein QUB80_04015 [Chlorogloeopsis sp. ULAP01]|uniref:hypothetical protein n=1 Tax=Chlorogloeopsis sp. ULAP01 TaxID=3056483 RepID=UPI0025AAA2F9|nr:hypothetical protein [Chlorogloeopsis sp. ULAP01]MDM9379863.1 hypothetical protein [Chlorogloeopsis sp. ULAP01]
MQRRCIRDHIFTFAQVQRHHAILDINAGSGFRSWFRSSRGMLGTLKAITIYVYIGILWGIGVDANYLKQFYQDIRSFQAREDKQ